FEVERVFAAVDILERTADGVRITEVKSTTKLKDEHIPDIAVQRWVVEGTGLPVAATRLMHLNRDCRAPDLSNLFATAPVDDLVTPVLPTVEPEVQAQLRMLAGPLPDVAIGDHCTKPYDCPFLDRCWPKLPPHLISTLPRLSAKKRTALQVLGVETIDRIPDDFELTDIQERQRRAVKAGRPLIEPELRTELAAFAGDRIAFLDFETVAPAIPVWDGCRPFDAVPAQVSVDVVEAGAVLDHHEWMASDAGDPRPMIAQTVVAACAGADVVVAFNAGFERRCLELVAEAVPEHAPAINAIIGRLRDLADPVRRGIYHPDFHGSYSLKAVIPALVPELAYHDLEVAEGTTASTRLAALMFTPERFSAEERERTRRHLLEYCARDTLVMVRLLDTLRSLA
ncbi:MAG TPA: DUF2779 domain-containing protein, partial [Gemmatimonadales bacterium]|nr:DUF2779 domain-containing protein [Gemmatimonadales bacterium]